jgi:hypothetical protein
MYDTEEVWLANLVALITMGFTGLVAVLLIIAALALAGCGMRERVTDTFDDSYCRGQSGRAYKECMDRLAASRHGGTINANISRQ